MMTCPDPSPFAPELPLTALDLAFAGYLQSAQPSGDVRHTWLAALTSHQFGRGHACLDLGLLRQAGAAALGWDGRWQAAWPPALEAAAASLPWTQGEASPLVLQGERLYLRRSWQAERQIRASILERLSAPVTPASALRQTLDALFGAAVQPAQPGSADRPHPPHPPHPSGLPDWQKVACALAARGRFTLLTGGPGTGKTTTVVRLLALLQMQSAQPLRIALAAPTGKAAARLGESVRSAVQKLPLALPHALPAQAQTLHKLLQVRPSVRDAPAPLLALDVVVVDEASMIDLELMARLMRCVPASARLILLGDKDQLASVEAGAVMGQLCACAQAGNYTADTVRWLAEAAGQDVGAWAGCGSLLAQHTVMLRHSHRFAKDSRIGQWARAVNAGDLTALAGLWQAAPDAGVPAQTRGSAGRDCDAGAAGATRAVAAAPGAVHGVVQEVARLQPRQATDAELAALARRGWSDWLQALAGTAPATGDAEALEMLTAFGRFQVLCALRDGPWGVQALNRALARALGFPAEGWYPGRPVMVTRNDYDLQRMNGDVGVCLNTGRGLRVAFATLDAQGRPGVHWVLPSRLEAVETVFAMTVHKSQGSEFDHVALVLPERMAPVLSRELLYTGITRARTQLTLVAPQAAVLRQAAAQVLLRSGGLAMNEEAAHEA